MANGGVTQNIVLIVGGIISLVLGAVVVGMLVSNVPTSGFTAEANKTVTDIINLTSPILVITGIGLLAAGVAPIVRQFKGGI